MCPGHHVRPSSQHAELSVASDLGSFAHYHVFGQDRALNHRARLDARAQHDDAVGDLGVRTHAHALEKHAVLNVAVDVAPLRHHASVKHSLLSHQSSRHERVARIHLPGVIAQVEARVVLEQVHVGIPEALQGAHVAPVALEAIGVELLACAKHGRNNIFTKVVA